MRDEPSQTAESVCLCRAVERARPKAERILDDRFAELFLGRGSRAGLAAYRVSGRLAETALRYAPGLMTYVVVRHRRIDDWLERALGGPLRQVVLLGAGYDSRAYRFAERLAGRPVFELDFPATRQRKLRVLSQHASALPDTRVEHVAIDFLSEKLDEKLLAAGFERGAPSFFVWEGVSMYLTRDAVKQSLATVRALSAPGSQIAMDFWYLLDDPTLVGTAHRVGPNLLHLAGEPLTLSMHPEDVEAFLHREGYALAEFSDAAALERLYVRDERPVYPALYLVLARTREA